MAKKSMINREKKRERLVRKFAARRAELKKTAKDPSKTCLLYTSPSPRD